MPNLEGLAASTKYGNQFNVLQRLRFRDDYVRRGQQVRIIKVRDFPIGNGNMEMDWELYLFDLEIELLMLQRSSPRVREARRNLSFDARPFHPSTSTGEGSTSNPPALNDHLSSHQQQIGERLYAKVREISNVRAPPFFLFL